MISFALRATREVGALRIALGIAVACCASLLNAPTAFAHATISPVVATAGQLQQFTLSVPTEKENVTTTSIELELPPGFTIDSYAPAPGWKRRVTSAAADRAGVQRVTWSGGSVPTEEDAVFAFDASGRRASTYVFHVRQTYSDGSIVDWAGPESSDAPAPRLQLVSIHGSGKGGSETIDVIALIVATVALVLAGISLIGTNRPLT